MWTTWSPFLLLKFGAEEGARGQGWMSGSSACATCITVAVTVAASLGWQVCCKPWQPPGHEGKEKPPGTDWTPFSPQLVLVRLSCSLKLQKKAFVRTVQGKGSRKAMSSQAVLRFSCVWLQRCLPSPYTLKYTLLFFWHLALCEQVFLLR